MYLLPVSLPELDPRQYPRAATYLAAGAMGAHDDARSKASVLRGFANEGTRRGTLLADYRSVTGNHPDELLPTHWLRAADIVLFELMVADALGSDDAFLDYAREANEALLSSPLYRAIIFVVSPATLVRGAQGRWGQFHRGIPLTGEVEGKEARMTLSYGEGLFPELIVREKAGAFAVAARAAGAKELQIELSWGARESTFDLRWS